MPIPTYTPGYPPDNSSLGQTKTTIRNNLDGTFQTLAVDHINNNGQPGSKPAGYHTVIHEVPQTSVNTVSGYNQVFSGVPGTLVVNSVTTPAIPPNNRTQLFSLTGGGDLAQLTGYVANANGYAWAGGILFQWGFVNSTNSTYTPQDFNVTFPNNIFIINTQLYSVNTEPSGEATLTLQSSSITTSGFSWAMITNSDKYKGFYWLAIGN